MSCLDVQLLIVQYSLEDCPVRPRALSRLLHCPVPTATVAIRYCHYLQSKKPSVTRFRKALRTGDVYILRWLTHEFKLTGADVRNCDNCAFRSAARIGHLNVLRWLTEEFKLTGVDARAEDNYAFRVAARNGNLEMLRWLTEEFKLTGVDVGAEDNYAFRWAARNGHFFFSGVALVDRRV